MGGELRDEPRFAEWEKPTLHLLRRKGFRVLVVMAWHLCRAPRYGFSKALLSENFGVAVCYDFMDLDRIVLYRKKIQTLFILAYNRDTTSFGHLAEALARMVFCNVVVCNCGVYGGSLAVSPFREPSRRTIYRHSGQKLPNAQLIKLPLATLKAHQNNCAEDEREFKSLPAGFADLISLTTTTKTL